MYNHDLEHHNVATVTYMYERLSSRACDVLYYYYTCIRIFVVATSESAADY